MPARVIDGDSLWRSKKLKKMSPTFRGEYANLVPLAEANGVFDCDPERVWSDVYAFNRPEINVETVEKILYELEQVDLLRRWKDKDKIWGYWTGIHKSGRLPVGKHLERYKNLPPNPPDEIRDAEVVLESSGISPGLSHDDPPWFGIGLDRFGIGVVREENPDENDFPENGQEDEMKAKKAIPALCQQILHQKADMYPDTVAQIEAYAISTSNGQVIRQFEEWAVENVYEEFRGRPVAAFLRSLDNPRVTEARQVASDPQTIALARELAYLSDGVVSFNDKEKGGLGKLLTEGNTKEELLSVFRTFFADIQNDEFALKFAAKNFVEKADQLVYTARRKATERTTEQAAVARAAEEMTRRAEEERRTRLEAQEREKEQIEEELPD